jgi:P4 family phage/plasmid primase-like protien
MGKRGLVDVHTDSIMPVLKRTFHIEKEHIGKAHFVGRHRVWMCRMSKPVECAGCGDKKVVVWNVISGELSYRCTTGWCRHPHRRFHVEEETMACVDLEDRVNALERTDIKKPKSASEATNTLTTLLTVGGSALASFVFDACNKTGAEDTWTGSTWYHFHRDEHRWKPDKNKMNVHLLVEEVVGGHLKAHVDKAEDDEVTQAWEALRKRMGDRAHREKAVRDMETAFFDPTFVSKLDANRNLVVFANGVYDCTTAEFRAGRPDDFSTLSTNTNYVSIPKHMERAIMGFLEKIIPSAETLSMVLTSVALSMRGIPTSRFFLWVGCGSNGKSKLASLFRAALGEYAVAIPVSLFTQKRAESGRAMPELSRTSGRRVAFISEPSHNETLNLGIVKEVTGGDAMFTRGLYEAGSEITCGFVPILLCNVLPAVTDTSHGAWRRLVSVTFPTLFVEHPKLPNEVKLDSYADESIRVWADTFATMIATYKVEGQALSIPKECLMTTLEYRTESDFYSEYIHERIIHTGHDYDDVKWTDLWSDFYAWFVLSYGRSHIPKKAEAKKKFQETLNPNPKKGPHKFVGYLIDRSK